MTGQGLGRLGRHVRPAEVGDEGVPHGVEVGVEAIGVLVSQEIRLLAFLALGVALDLGDPDFPGRSKVSLNLLTPKDLFGENKEAS